MPAQQPRPGDDPGRDGHAVQIPQQQRWIEQVVVASTTPMPRADPSLDLSLQTMAWLAGHSHARRLVHVVWNKLTELERAGHPSCAIAALRRVLIHHQPTSSGLCRTCRRWTGRRYRFPCIVWHQIRGELLG